MALLLEQNRIGNRIGSRINMIVKVSFLKQNRIGAG